MQDELRQQRALKERAMRERDAAVSDKFSVEQVLQVSLLQTIQDVDHNLQFFVQIVVVSDLFKGSFWQINVGISHFRSRPLRRRIDK